MMLRRIYLCAALILLAASFAFAAEDRILGNPDSGRVSILLNTVHPSAQPQLDQGAVDTSTPIRFATLLLKPATGLEAFLASQQDPASAAYHRWLSPEQFGDRFGLSSNDIGKIVSWLKTQGFVVNDIARGRAWITFSGNAGQVTHAFHTDIHRYLVGGAMHFANSAPLSIPVEFEGAVSGVKGLDDFRLKPLYRLRNALAGPYFNVGSEHLLAPDDIAAIYDIAPLYQAGVDGTGQKIAIVGQTDIDLADIRAFRKAFNLSANDPRIVLYGDDPGTTGDAIEADLDLEWSGAIARNAALVYVNSSDVGTSAQYAVDQNLASIMTMSYGGCEQESLELFRAVAQQANAQGITFMAASGDSAAATCDRDSVSPQASKGLAVSYPASIPEITAVGGTELNEGSGNYWASVNGPNHGSALSYIPETAWNDSALENGIVGGGGGISLFFTKPWWQAGSGVPFDGARDVPDVALASSADHDGYAIVSGGSNLVVGGTSVASPMFAGIVALLNQSQIASRKQAQPGLGNINPQLYRLAAAQTGAFHDTTSGDNRVQCQQGSPNCVNGALGYSAVTGYDLATGLGSVDASHLVSAWTAGTATTTVVTAGETTISPNDRVVLTANVSGATGIPTGTVTFLSDDSALGSGSLNAGTANATIPGSLLASGGGVISALYSGDGTFAGSSGALTLPLAIATTASYIVPSVFPNPVYEVDGQWVYEIELTQKASVATTITAFTVDGVNSLSYLRKTSYAGAFDLTFNNPPPVLTAGTHTFHFTGTDAGGSNWAVDLPVAFLGPLGLSVTPGIALIGSPTSVQQNPSGDPSCQWVQQLTVRETGGFEVGLSRLTLGATNLTSAISQFFGTTQLAPYGQLNATLCVSGVSAPAQKTITISGTADDGTTVGATYAASFAGPAALATTMSASPAALVLSTIPGSLNLNFGAGLPSWTATILTSGKSSWLTVSPASGTGSATLVLQPHGSELSSGVYNAVLLIQSTNTAPQFLQVPVAFVVSRSSGTSIQGVNSAASASQGFAPGMWMAVYGTNLAPSTQLATSLPLPLSLAGTSATVNGIAAPLWFVSSGQMNIQIPYETSAGTAVLGVSNNGSTAAYTFPVAPSAPGIFNTSLTGKPGQTIVAYISGEGDVTPTLFSGTVPASGTKLSQYPRPRLPLMVSVGGENANIAFDGIVSLVGVTQVNFTIPPDIRPGNQAVVVTVGGVASVPINILVTAP